MTYLAVSISGSDVEGCLGQIASASSAGAEMLELRADYIKGLSKNMIGKLVGAARGTGLPVIVTCRDAAEGGAGGYGQELRTDVLVEAVSAGAEFVDCELANFTADVRTKLEDALAKQPGSRLILSAHNFEGCFADLEGLYEDMREARADAVAKVVYTARHVNDCFAGMDLLRNKRGDAIVLCMGQAGLLSRILAQKLGGFVTFAAGVGATATAPGQITIEELKNLYRWDNVNAETKLFGVIGSPVAHSLSPAIFNACFDRTGTNALYVPVLVDGGGKEFDGFMEKVTAREWLGFRGFSVTIPHKANALNYVEKHGEFEEPLAIEIGAVNTLKIGLNERVSGYNTDYAGAMDALTGTLGIGRRELHGVKVAVLGAGGVARAIVAGLSDVGAKITIYNRTVAKGQSLAEEFGCRFAPLAEAGDMQAAVVVNCTSIGMWPDVDASPVDGGCLTSEMAVFDTVYNPLETLLLKDAGRAGAKTVNGAEMFVGQAMRQLEIFTGKAASDADVETIRKTVFDRLCLADRA